MLLAVVIAAAGIAAAAWQNRPVPAPIVAASAKWVT